MGHFLLSRCFRRGPIKLVPSSLTKLGGSLCMKGIAKRLWKWFYPCYHIGNLQPIQGDFKEADTEDYLEAIINLVSVPILILHASRCVSSLTQTKRERCQWNHSESLIYVFGTLWDIGTDAWLIFENTGTVAWTTLFCSPGPRYIENN